MGSILDYIVMKDAVLIAFNSLFTFVNNIIATKNYTNKYIVICGSVLSTIKDNTEKSFYVVQGLG